MGSHHYRYRVWKVCALCLAAAALTALGGFSSARAQNATLSFERPRTIDTSDFVDILALDEPLSANDLAFPPWSRTLLRLDGADAAGATLRRPGDRRGRSVAAPTAVTFAEQIGLAVLDDARDRLTLRRQDGADIDFDLSQIRVRQPVGIALDPRQGTLFILDRGGRRLLRISPSDGDYDAAAAARNGRLGVRTPASQRLRGLAFNPGNGRLFSTDRRTGELVELSDSGGVLNRYTLDGGYPAAFRAMTFAPSSDRTDAASQQSLYVAYDAAPHDAAVIEWSITETAPLSTGDALAAPRVAAQAAFDDDAVFVQTIDTSGFPSPDPAGITYLEFVDRLLLSDSEVNEIPQLFSGNLFELTTLGVLETTTDTLSFSNEPTGLVYDPLSDHVFVSDDDRDEIYQVDPGADAQYGTADDVVTSFDTRVFDSYDPEGIAFDSSRNMLFIADGNNAEVYRITPGPNGVFDGTDDIVSSFDTTAFGVYDPEGIVYDDANDLLYLAGEPKDSLAHVTSSGSLVRRVNIAVAQAYNPAGLTLAPGSQNPSILSIYIADRAVDNNIDPNENDGEIHELYLPPLNAGNLPPGADAGPDLGVSLIDGAALNGSISDDGQPNPPATVTASWSKVSGPGSVTFSSPAAAVTQANFSAVGTYVLRLTASDGALITSDDVTVNVLDVPQASGLIYLSTDANGSIGGFSYRDEDIISYDINNGVWALVFDGSDVGLGDSRQEIDAFAVDADGSILLSLRYETTLPDVGAVDDSDIVRFTPSSTGSVTAGVYSWFLDASDVGLTGSGEDIDAIGFTPDGQLLISTNGSLNTDTVFGRDEDLFVLTDAVFGAASSGVWSLYFDGSDVGLSDSSEDLAAVSIDADGNVLFSTRGNYAFAGNNGDGADIVNCSLVSSGAVTDCVFTLFWDASASGFSGTVNGLSFGN